MEIINKNIKYLMNKIAKENNLNIIETLEKLDIKLNTYIDYITNKEPSLKDFYKFSRFFKISMETLYTIDLELYEKAIKEENNNIKNNNYENTSDKLTIKEYINKLDIKKTNKCRLEVNYSQLKQIYKDFNLRYTEYEDSNKNLENLLEELRHITDNQKQKELKSWIMNIKHTYELLQKAININFIGIKIYFEYWFIDTTRADVIIEYNNNFLIIECSSGYTNKRYIEKEKQVNKYYEEFKKECNTEEYKDRKTYNRLDKVVYFDDYYESENETIHRIKELFQY